MYISKKDLLKETNISYGQLYRWKREKLIPEEWFVKQSSYTGQETFFPKEKVLKRVQMIQEMKDLYSFEDLAKIFSPEIGTRLFSKDELSEIEEVEAALIDSYMDVLKRDRLTYIELLILILFSSLHRDHSLSIQQSISLIVNSSNFIESIKITDCNIYLALVQGEYYTIFSMKNNEVFVDQRIEIKDKIHLEEVSNKVKTKYQSQLFE